MSRVGVDTVPTDLEAVELQQVGKPTTADTRKQSTLSKFESPFSARVGKDLSWTNLTYTAQTKKGPKTILNGTWGTVPGGKLACILGPSGAGKSSLLNVLAGRVAPSSKNKITGTVSVNSSPINPVKYRSKIAYVMQDDALFPTMTPREALRFSAALRIPNDITEEQKHKLVEQMITELGLTKCADTLIGNLLIKGISGGERKRTSVGVELVTNPSLVFLDEPTSGLDSYSAYQCVDLLRKVAAAGSAVLCTIHQPSSDVFQMFDLCFLLKDGHLIFAGEIQQIASHFSRAGVPVPDMFNPADHLINVVQKHSVQELTDMKVLMSPDDAHHAHSGSTSFGAADTVEITTRASMMTQLRWLLWREIVGIFRNVGGLIGRFGVSLTLNLIFGLIFQHAGGRDDSKSDNLSGHFGALTMIAISSMFGNAQPVLLTFPFERPIFLREYATGTYSSFAYFVSKMGSELPLSFVQNVASLLVTYWLVEMDGNFILLAMVMWGLGCAATSVAMFLGSAANDVTAATEASPILFVPQILFSGFFIRISLIPVFMRWAQYLCSLKYAVNLILIIEFGTCENNQQQCDNLLANNDVEKDLWWLYFLILIALFFAFRLLSLFILTVRAKNFY